MSAARYAALLFDLFGTLIDVDPGALSEVAVGGRRVRSTAHLWDHLLAELVPEVTRERFVDALATVSDELARARRAASVEFPSRERFRRALVRVGCADALATEAAPLLSRAHLRGLAAATRFPPERAALLARASERGVLGVVTNFDDTTTAYEILERHGILARTRSVVVSEAVGLRKPHPVLVRIALRELGAAPHEAIMIGDDLVEDVGAADGAGVDAAWIDPTAGGVPASGPHPRYVLRSFAEIVRLLE